MKTKRFATAICPRAALLKRVFFEDIKKCPQCAGVMMIIAAITDATVVCKILNHLGLPSTPPKITPARLPEQLEFDWTPQDDDYGTSVETDDCEKEEFVGLGRSPPD